jgi:hypothetical protein
LAQSTVSIRAFEARVGGIFALYSRVVAFHNELTRPMHSSGIADSKGPHHAGLNFYSRKEFDFAIHFIVF